MDPMGLPQGPGPFCSLLRGLRLCPKAAAYATRREGFEHNLCPLGSGFLSVSKWQDLLFKYQASLPDFLSHMSFGLLL